MKKDNKTDNNIRVSVFCITYNHGKYLEDALKGFISQVTDFDYEIIIHDDCSTDNTREIIQKYADMYPDIIVPILQQENIHQKGISCTLEYMLPLAKGKYIAQCEGDDYWNSEHKLQRQFDYMEKHERCSLVVHKSLNYYMDTQRFTPFSAYRVVGDSDIPVEDVIRDHLIFHTSSMFFRKSFFENNLEFLKSHPLFDYTMKFMLATEGEVHIIDEVMSVYRRGVEGAWSVNVVGDNTKLIAHIKTGIAIMEDINAYREYRYNDMFQNALLGRKFWLEEELGNFGALKKKPYDELYKKLPLVSKLRLFLRWRLTFLYRPIMILFHGIKKGR